MKKIIKKKLVLKKRTVVNLANDDQNNVRGGFTLVYTCVCHTEVKSCSLGINCCPPPEGDFAQSFDC